jgi:NitT/TauT family transport system permease protein
MRIGAAGVTLRVAQVCLVVLIIGAWAWLAQAPSNKLILSSPLDVARLLGSWATDGGRWGDLWITLDEALRGYAIGTVAGILLALAVSSSGILRDVLAPFLAGFNALPKVALAPLFIVWFGLGEQSKVYFVVAGILFISFSNVAAGLAAIDHVYMDHARLIGASRWWVLRDIVLPTTIGWLMMSLRLCFSWALLSAVLAEYLGALGGIGKIVADGAASLDQTSVIAGILVVAIIAVVVDRFLALVERRFTRWRAQ